MVLGEPGFTSVVEELANGDEGSVVEVRKMCAARAFGGRFGKSSKAVWDAWMLVTLGNVTLMPLWVD